MSLAACLLPRHYKTMSSFEEEQRHFFPRLWIFVGMANELSRHNDFVRVTIAGRDIIIQNCGGVFRAFANACSHRHSRIHEDPSGNRRLTCPYHGWSYDDK